MARSLQRSNGSTTETLTLTLNQDDPASSSSDRQPQQQILVLPLRRPKKKVTWKEGTVDNEFLNRRSSKKCCIFHKEKPFDEDDSDDDGDCGHGSDRKENGEGTSGCCSRRSN